MDVRGSKCFKKLVPLILTHVCLCQGELLTYDSLSPQTALSVWTAPKVPFSLLFVKTDGSPHSKSCWHLTPVSRNCVNMTSRTFVALHYNYVHVQFFEGWPFLKHPNVLERFSIENIIFLNVLTFAQDKVSADTASWFPKCYKKLDGLQDAGIRGSPYMPNKLLEQ